VTATLTRKSPKEPSLKQLARASARGIKDVTPLAGSKPPASLAAELNKSIRERAGRLESLQGVDISDEDRSFLGFVYSGMNLNAGDVVRLQCLLERHAKALNGKHNGNGHPAMMGTTTPAGIMANDSSATRRLSGETARRNARRSRPNVRRPRQPVWRWGP
jgi:hypothetical protein